MDGAEDQMNADVESDGRERTVWNAFLILDVNMAHVLSPGHVNVSQVMVARHVVRNWIHVKHLDPTHVRMGEHASVSKRQTEDTFVSVHSDMRDKTARNSRTETELNDQMVVQGFQS